MSASAESLIPEQTNTQPSSSTESILSNESQTKEEEGIIEVVKQTHEEEEDEELKLLHSLEKFEPFIKDSDKSFSFENLLGIKSNPKPTISSKVIKDREALANPVLHIVDALKTYIKENMSHINMEQRLLYKRILNVNELSTTSNSIMANAHNQAKLAADKITETTALKDQATKAHENAIQLFKSLSLLEKHLDPEDRITESKWPELYELRSNALKHPSIERYISTSSDLTTVGTSTSPLLDKIIVTGEPVKDETLDTQPNINQRSTSTSSLALDRLRGLSSRSIRDT